MMHEHPRGRRFTLEIFKLYHRMEHLEPWVLKANESIAKIGEGGILNNHLLIGPPMIFAANKKFMPAARYQTLARSAVDTSKGLGMVTTPLDITSLPRPDEAWTVDPVSIDDDFRFIPFERCHVLERLVLIQRVVPHLRHATEVLLHLARHASMGFWHHQDFMPANENTDAPVDSDAWHKAIEDLIAALALALGGTERP